MNEEVLKATIEGMPNLDTILCLGKVPYLAVQNHYGFSGDWREDRDQQQWRKVNGIKVCAMTHPGPLGIINHAIGTSPESSRALVAEDFAVALSD